MALWQQFKSISLLQGSTEKFHEIYSSLPEGKLVLCLRVVFASWIEEAIGKVSPTNFLRGLQFQIQKAFEHNCAKDIKNLGHPAHLSKYTKFLSNINSPQKIDAFYSNLLKCICEEYKTVRLRNMEVELDADVSRFVEALDIPRIGNGNEIDRYKDIILTQSRSLLEFANELGELIKRLRSSCERFYQDKNHYDATSRESDCPTMYNLLIAISISLVDEATQILNIKANLEEKVSGICDTASLMTENLRMYLHQYERLHIFANRSGNFGGDADIEKVGLQVDAVANLLHQIHSSMVSCERDLDFQRMLRINHDMIVRTDVHGTRASLMVPDSYINRFNELAGNVKKQLWSLYESFTLVVDCQPPMVMMKGSRYTPISLRFFNLNNVCKEGFSIKACLVNEQTALEIRSKNVIPDQITSVGSIIIKERSKRNSNSNATGRGGLQNKSRRRRSGDEVNSTVGSKVVTLNETCVPNRKSYHVEKELIVQTIERDSTHHLRQRRPSRERQGTASRSGFKKEDSDNVTSEKVAMLFIMELTLQRVKKQIWAMSLPMIVAAHGSQNEKAWLTIAWDDAFAMPRRRGFEVRKTASWSQISDMLKGTFEVLVRSPLKPSHLAYLRSKAEESIAPRFFDAISKKLLSEGQDTQISFWSWFYNTLLVIKENGHFHEVWKNCYIEGFIDYKSASSLLRNSNVQPGTFVVRFSDAKPGSITLVFLANNNAIYKMQPVEVHKSKSALECAASLLRILNVIDSSQGKEVFLQVFPNISKRVAFKKFYEIQKTKGQQIPKEYVQVSNMIPILPSSIKNKSDDSRSKTDNEGGNGFQMSNDTAATTFDGYNNDEMQIDERKDAYLGSNNSEDNKEEDKMPELGFDAMDTSFLNDGECMIDLAEILSYVS